MRWTERQRAMLREMGIELWARETPGSADADAAESAGAVLVAPPRSGPAPVIAREPDRQAPRAAQSTGTAPAVWLVVGEPFDAPEGAAGEQEQLLDNMLRAIGVSRAASARESRAAYMPLTDRADEWQARVDAAKPKCIIALGRAAAQALLGTEEQLGALRGRRHLRHGVPVVVTFSLAFLLRHADEKAKAWADLCLAARAFDESSG